MGVDICQAIARGVITFANYGLMPGTVNKNSLDLLVAHVTPVHVLVMRTEVDRNRTGLAHDCDHLVCSLTLVQRYTAHLGLGGNHQEGVNSCKATRPWRDICICMMMMMNFIIVSMSYSIWLPYTIVVERLHTKTTADQFQMWRHSLWAGGENTHQWSLFSC